MSKFLSKILLPVLMREAGIFDVDEESMMIKKPNMNNNENNWGRIEDVEEDDASKKLKENSIKKIIENKYEAALGVQLREKYLKKPVVADPLMENDSIIMSSEFSTERKRKRKSSKRKAKSNGRSGEGSSSRNNINPTEEPAPPLPIQFKNAIFSLAQGRTVLEIKLVIQKQLFASDMAQDQNRFTIPANQIREEFLSNEEKTNLSKYASKGRKMAMKVKIIEPLLGEGTVELRRWDLKKDSGRSSSSYVLNKTWGKIRENNKLMIGDVMQLWAVRVDEELLFVLVKLA
ncbi:B3 domain-containing protein At5g24050-like [Olea europaea var. sylvestris]|uniref:B3 domain-containing protein At5g24050-like n=1 Tax=Olea europaea var. sylvestris TaxID=158386 RepID=UPI000C1CD091|nr:B3 domain-containing protein At5g24050-like [Olea europaea var. sylvestris]